MLRGTSRVCTIRVSSSDLSIPFMLCAGRIENRLLLDNKDVHFTCCAGENPDELRMQLQVPGPWVRLACLGRHPAGMACPLKALGVHPLSWCRCPWVQDSLPSKVSGISAVIASRRHYSLFLDSVHIHGDRIPWGWDAASMFLCWRCQDWIR